MMVPHQPWFVALSVAIAIQGSFVGLSLAQGLARWEGFRRRLALAGSAISLATGVWSMHFVGMLAAIETAMEAATKNGAWDVGPARWIAEMPT